MCAQERWAATPSDGFGEQRAALLADRRLGGTRFARAYAELVDRWLAELLGDVADVALVGVGGYGGAQLAPASDIDVVLVHRGRPDIAEVARRVWYPIWDAGVRLDHSVKTVNEALAVAGRDLRAALGLLTARPVAGDPELGAEVGRRAREQWRVHARRWLPMLGLAVKERHERMGDVAYLLEPDLKEGRGGLRDITALRAAALAAPVVPEEDLDRLDASDTLMAARVALHRVTARASDCLLLQHHGAVAELVGLADGDDLMRAVAHTARTVGWASDDAWRRIEAWVAGPAGRISRSDRPLRPGVALRDSEVVALASADTSDDALVLRVAAAAAEANVPIARRTLERLGTEATLPGEPWSDNARLALVDLLGTGPGCVAAFEALDQYGLLSRLLPEWEPVRSQAQHNPYHRFTVDRHLIEAAVEASALAGRITRPDLLLVAAWLHDLGKGYPGDHTDAGTQLMARIAPRLGFSPEDQAILVKLVRHHLLLAETATRRDVRDPATVAKVADAVGDLETLALLHALTEADGRATGPTAWTAWKSELVAELVRAVDDALRSGVRTAGRRWSLDPTLEPLVEEAEGGLLVWAHGAKVVVVAPDRRGLFYQLAGVLALHGLDVLAADVWSAPGVGQGTAVDRFVVERPVGDPPDWARFQADVSRALRGELAIETRLAERAASYAHRSPRARHAVEPHVVADEEASSDATVIEVRAPNTVGALYRIARALSACRVDIRHAKVLTLGHEIVDSFYVVDEEGAKLGRDLIGEVERAVLSELSKLVA